MQMGAKIENFGELFGVLLGEQLGARSEKFGELFGASGPPQAWPHVIGTQASSQSNFLFMRSRCNKPTYQICILLLCER